MKKIVVLGGGISGYGSAILAKKKGFDVFLSDKGRIADRYKAKLDQWQVPYEEGHHSEERILAADEVVKSPGIPDKAPMIVKLREAGIPVISEMEFAGRYLGKARTICVTGSNGKTTTTSLIYKILRDAGYNVAPRRQHRREFRLLGRYRRLRLVRTGVELVPARRHVPVPRPYRRADEHHARPPRPLRLLFPELRGCQDAHYAEPEFARLLHLFGRRRGDLAAVAQIRPADEAAPLRGQKRRGERRRRCVPSGRKIHRNCRPGVGGDRHGQNADSRAAQRL